MIWHENVETFKNVFEILLVGKTFVEGVKTGLNSWFDDFLVLFECMFKTRARLGDGEECDNDFKDLHCFMNALLGERDIYMVNFVAQAPSNRAEMAPVSFLHSAAGDNSRGVPRCISKSSSLGHV